jgi:hypothetical protein
MKSNGFSAQSLIKNTPAGHLPSSEMNAPYGCPVAGAKPVKRRGMKDMGSKQKKTQLGRKEYFERKLKERLAFLSEKRAEPSQVDKDPRVKNLRANIRAVDARLKAIAKLEQRKADMAKAKADKAAAALQAKESGKEKEKAKEPKKAAEEPKAKKKKKEKEGKEEKEEKKEKE